MYKLKYLREAISYSGIVVYVSYTSDVCYCMTDMKKQCIDFVINAKPACRYMPKNKSSAKFRVWKLVVSTPFEYFIMVMIAMNTIILMMKVSASLLRLVSCLLD